MNSQEVAGSQEYRSEEELRLSRWMVEAQKDNAECYRKLLTELITMLEKYAVRAVKRYSPKEDTFSAPDIVQEVLLAIHDKRHTYNSSQRFLPWVFGIARHKTADWQRKHFSDRRWLDIDFEIENAISPENSLWSALSANGQPSTGLQSLLKKLNPKQREVIELTKIEGISVAEAAERMGLSEANVKVLTHRGISVLKKFVEDFGE